LPHIFLFPGSAGVERSILEQQVAESLAALGFELVEFRVGGSARRPLLSVRIDRADSAPGHGVTVDDCAVASRTLEAWLDREGVGGGRYILEVSSPGVDRPLRTIGDWQRFTGSAVDVLIPPLGGRFRVRVGAVSTAPEPVVELVFPGGERRSMRLTDIKEARLGFDW
jgi:ribosome maturation factor RimP